LKSIEKTIHSGVIWVVITASFFNQV